MKTLALSNEIFTAEAISAGVKAYAGIASIQVDETDGYFICHLRDCIYGEAQTAFEFENYVIDVMNSAAK